MKHRFFRLNQDCSLLYSDSIISEKGLNKLKILLALKGESIDLEIEEVDPPQLPEGWFNHYYVPVYDITNRLECDSTYERNVFHDASGKEYHN